MANIYELYLEGKTGQSSGSSSSTTSNLYTKYLEDKQRQQAQQQQQDQQQAQQKKKKVVTQVKRDSIMSSYGFKKPVQVQPAQTFSSRAGLPDLSKATSKPVEKKGIGQYGETKISQAKPKNIWQKVGQSITNFFESPETIVAKDQNIYAIQKAVEKNRNAKIPLQVIDENYDQLTKELGIRDTATGEELAGMAIAVGIAVGLVTHPLATIKTVVGFTALGKAKELGVSTVKPGAKTFTDLLPENTPDVVSRTLGVAEFLADMVIFHKLSKQAPKAVEFLTKDIITKYELPKTLEIDKATIRQFFIEDSKLPKATRQAILDLKLSTAEIKLAVKNGVAIEVPWTKVVTIADKPYWSKAKKIFRIPGTPETIFTTTLGKTNEAPYGLLEPGEYTSQEIMNKVIGNEAQETLAGKNLIKEAIQVEKAGQTIKIEPKAPPEPIVEPSKIEKATDKVSTKEGRPEHIQEGVKLSKKLTEKTVKTKAIDQIQGYIDRNKTLEGYKQDVNLGGGTFGAFEGNLEYKKGDVTVTLADGRVFKFKAKDIYESGKIAEIPKEVKELVAQDPITQKALELLKEKGDVRIVDWVAPTGNKGGVIQQFSDGEWFDVQKRAGEGYMDELKKLINGWLDQRQDQNNVKSITYMEEARRALDKEYATKQVGIETKNELFRKLYYKEQYARKKFLKDPTEKNAKAWKLAREAEEIVETPKKKTPKKAIKKAPEKKPAKKELVLKPSKAKTEKKILREVKKIGGEAHSVTALKTTKGQLTYGRPIIGKPEMKILLTDKTFKANPVFVVDKDKKLIFESKTSKIWIPASSLQISPHKLKAGDKIRVDIKALRETGTLQQLRVYKGGSAFASIDTFKTKTLAEVAENYNSFKPVEFPELVRIVKELTGELPSVKLPRSRPSLGGRPLGLFAPVGKGKVILNPDIFKTPEQAVATLAHELGHLTDYLPEGTMARGNLLGRLLTLNKNMKQTFAGAKEQGVIDELKIKRDSFKADRKELKADGEVTDKPRDRALYNKIVDLNKKIKKLEAKAPFKNKAVSAELKKVTHLWKPFDADAVPDSYLSYRYKPAELYADAISVLFNDPKMLEKNAPIFYKGFFEFLDKKPEAKKNFFKIWDLLNKGEEAVLSVRDKELAEMFTKGEDLFKTKLIEKAEREKDLVFRLKYELIDKNQKVIDLVNKANKAGKAIADEDNPIYYLEEGNYVGGVVKAWLEENLQPIYKNLKDNEVGWEDFGKILFLKRVQLERGGTVNPVKLLRKADSQLLEGGITNLLEIGKESGEDLMELPEELKDLSAGEMLDLIEKMPSTEQFKMLKKIFSDKVDQDGRSAYGELTSQLPKGIANPLGYDVETATTQLKFLKEGMGDKYDIAMKNIKAMRKSVKALIPEAYKSGLYTEKMAKQMIANPAYATFQVLDYLDTYIASSVKQQVGTLKEISNPAGATVLKTISTIRAIEKNNTKRAVVNFLSKEYPTDITPAKTIWTGKKKIPVESREPDKKLLTFMKDGKLTGVYVDPYIASIFDSLGTGQTNAVVEGFRFMNSKLFKPLFTTYNLGFQTFNVFRDFFRYYKNTPELTIGKALKSYGKALEPAKARAWGITNKTITEMEKSKVLGITYNDLIKGLTSEDKMVEAVLNKYDLNPTKSDAKKSLFKLPMAIMEQIEKTGNFVETIPKVAGYRHLQGKLPAKELASFVRTSVGSPDFLRKGNGYGWYNDIFLYSNAMKEGMRADFNVAVSPRTRSGFWWKTMVTTILPKLLQFAGVLGLFGAGVKKMLGDASEYDKTSYTVLPLGVDENGKTVYLRIPQDETGRFIGGLTWKLLMLTQEEEFGADDVAQLLSYTGGQVPSLTPAITSLFGLTQFLAGQNPYDFFRGRNVIPDTEFKAGGKYSLKPFITWELNNLGAGVFIKTYTTQQAPETKTWVQKIIEAPLLSNIVGRWLKVSDYGQKEENWKIIDDLKQESAERSLERRELVDKYVDKYKKEKPGVVGKIEMEQALTKELLGHDSPENSDEKREVTNAIKKFDIGILRGKDNQNINSLIDASTNTAKVELLLKFKENLSKEEYEEILQVAKDNKVISDDVVDKLEAKLRSMVKTESRLAKIFKVKQAFAKTKVQLFPPLQEKHDTLEFDAGKAQQEVMIQARTTLKSPLSLSSMVSNLTDMRLEQGGLVNRDKRWRTPLENTPKDLESAFEASAKKYDMPVRYLTGIASRESSGYRKEVMSGKVKSSAGATGTMQFMPITMEELKRIGYKDFDPNNPKEAIEAGAFYLRLIADRTTGGDLMEAVKAYNAGEGYYRKYNGEIPFDETKNYYEYMEEVMK